MTFSLKWDAFGALMLFKYEESNQTYRSAASSCISLLRTACSRSCSWSVGDRAAGILGHHLNVLAGLELPRRGLNLRRRGDSFFDLDYRPDRARPDPEAGHPSTGAVRSGPPLQRHWFLKVTPSDRDACVHRGGIFAVLWGTRFRQSVRCDI